MNELGIRFHLRTSSNVFIVSEFLFIKSIREGAKIFLCILPGQTNTSISPELINARIIDRSILVILEASLIERMSLGREMSL